jgi:serine/threonine-protein kinase
VIVTYLTAIWLEHHGVIPYASLFTSGEGLSPPVPLYDIVVSISTGLGVTVIWMVGNLAVAVARENQARVAQLEAELIRAARQAQAGRLTGTRAGEYQLEELLGRGGMGEVYAARGPDRREVAIKVLHPHLSADETVRERFRRESAIVKQMPPGTVAEVLSTGVTSEGADFIVMERLRGEDLGARLRRTGRLSTEEALALAGQLARALDAAHALGIVHRDLKPTNIYLVHAPAEAIDLRLLDFGVAHLQDAALGATLTATGAVMGSPGYMAPEVIIQGATAATPAADIFACAAVLYLALTGRPAFSARSASGAFFEALNVTPASCSGTVPGIPPDVDIVLAIGLAKSAADRYRTASELTRDLVLAFSGELPDHVRHRAASLGGSLRDTTLTTLGES